MSTFAEESLSDESLQKELQNKDSIILALTEQLETTVDQLDRLKRSGAKEDSGGNRPQSPFGLASQVADALEAYDELAPAEHFDRIENGIDQILQLLSQGSVQLAESSSIAAAKPAPPKQDDSFWEETKARLMGGETSTSASPPPPPEQSQSYSQSTADDGVDSTDEQQSQTAEEVVDQEQVVVPAMPSAPKPVEDTKDIVAMELGVGERDEYIAYLVARLRAAEQAKMPAIDWNDLDGLPEKLIEELNVIKKQLEDQLRQSEIAASLERASLTRERSKLFQVKQYLAQEVKKLGEKKSSGDEEQKADRAESRWGKFFDTKK